MISALFSRLIILSFGTLYPAYSSYKAVRTKNVKEYVKWMMYWIVYAFFTCIETFTDIFLSWFPFYYEVKVIIVLWLLSPATKGSSTLYRKFVHPMLTRREQEIDEYLNQAKERGYSAVIQLGSKGVNYATNVIMQTALKTIHYSLNTTTDQNIRALPLSQSDNAIYVRSSMEHDENDTVGMRGAMWLPRSNSLNAMVNMDVEFSEEDDQMPEDFQNDERIVYAEVNEMGAARLREAPKRKTKAHTSKVGKERKQQRTQTKGVAVTNQKCAVSGGIRGRRKLREPTPDIDVDVE